MFSTSNHFCLSYCNINNNNWRHKTIITNICNNDVHSIYKIYQLVLLHLWRSNINLCSYTYTVFIIVQLILCINKLAKLTASNYSFNIIIISLIFGIKELFFSFHVKIFTFVMEIKSKGWKKTASIELII